MNYREHAIEGGRQVPTWPEAFVRGEGSVLAPYADLVRPALTERFDYEGELGLVIGSGGRYIPADKALDAIAGYVVLNDATARDWQRAGTQWTAGKNFEGSMPIGPEVVTTDEADVSDVALTTTLNGQVMQSARTSQMIVDIPSAIEYFSSFTSLRPGDVIATGTPGGVGFARQPPVWLQPGDMIEVSIEGVGTIRNRVVAEPGDLSGWRWRPSPDCHRVLSPHPRVERSQRRQRCSSPSGPRRGRGNSAHETSRGPVVSGLPWSPRSRWPAGSPPAAAVGVRRAVPGDPACAGDADCR